MLPGRLLLPVPAAAGRRGLLPACACCWWPAESCCRLCLLVLAGRNLLLPACVCCRMADGRPLAPSGRLQVAAVECWGAAADATLAMSARKKGKCREEKFLWTKI